MTGSANGNSTRHNCCRDVIPTPRAASFNAGSRPARPVTVFRSTGSTLYSVNPMNAGRKPMLRNPSADNAGTITASSARLGTV
jgi:hypothetical protein